MNTKLTAALRFALPIRTQRIHPCPYLCLIALATAAAMPSFAATQTVSNTNDSGAGSLRNAIAAAASGDTITFTSGLTGTITLTTGPLTIPTNLTITGPGASQLAISSNRVSGVVVVSPRLTVGISGLTIENGMDSGAGGLLNYGILTLTNCTVSGNSSLEYGGGIVNEATLTIVNSTISGNSSTQNLGGGIDNEGTLTLTNSTVANNSSADGGGGILNDGTATLVSSTISGNSGPGGFGGGIFNAGTLTIKSTLLANNGGGNCGNDRGTFTSLGYNLSDDGSCSSLTATGDESNVTHGAGLDSKGLQNNGGPTQTIALLTGSPAVDHIPVGACTDANGNPVTADQRSVSRPQGPACDVGAYELVEAVPFESFHPALAIATGKKPGFILTSTFTLASASTGLNPATEAMTLQIANYTLTLPAGSFHQLWNASNAPYGYEGTVNGATVVLGLVPLGNNTFSFDGAGSPVSFPGIKNPVTVTLSFGNDSGTANVQALITSF